MINNALRMVLYYQYVYTYNMTVFNLEASA